MEDEIRRTRAKKKYLRVTFPNGEMICYKNATSTMIEALKRIDSNRFPLIKLEMCYLPLISKEIYPKYKDYMKPICDGWYLNSLSNSDCKFLQLSAINKQLNLGMKIEIGSDFETQIEPYREKRTKSKDKLLIKMPYGEYIANDSAQETFLETVWQLGIDEIRKKDLSWGGNPLITSTKLFNNQIQVDRDWWIIVPNMTKDKVKLLRVIGAMLHVKMEINVI